MFLDDRQLDSGALGRRILADPLVSSELAGKASRTCLWLPGAFGNDVTAPDSSSLDITSDVHLQICLGMSTWQPAGNRAILAKTAASNRSYMLAIGAGGNLALYWTTDGTTNITATSTVANSFTAYQRKWIAAALDVDDGGVYKVYFYTADDNSGEPGTWSQLGTTITGGATTSIFSGSGSLSIGAIASFGLSVGTAMRVYRAIVRSGIDGTIVADYRADVPAVRYRDAYSNIWTVNGTSNAFEVA